MTRELKVYNFADNSTSGVLNITVGYLSKLPFLIQNKNWNYIEYEMYRINMVHFLHLWLDFQGMEKLYIVTEGFAFCCVF